MEFGRGRDYLLQRDNDLFQVLCALKANRRQRAERGVAFVEGVAPIKMAIASGLAPLALIHAGKEGLSDWANGLLARFPQADGIELSPELLGRLSEREEASELIALLPMPPMDLGRLGFSRPPFIVVLDRPSNPGNLGSILRSADAFGADAVILHGHACSPFDPAAIRASLGAAFSLSLAHAESLDEVRGFFAGLRAAWPGFKLYGSDSGGGLCLDSLSLTRPLALAFGNEARGLSQRLKEEADGILAIAMVGRVDSLNLACAASIVMSRVARA